MTQVICLWAGPGTGKSTTAAEVFAKLKRLGHNAELVREYAKEWAWQGRKINPLDSWLLFGIQAQRETELFGKVSHIVTDSPFLMGCMYLEHYGQTTVLTSAAADLYRYIHQTHPEVSYRHILLVREKPYNQAGRYEDEAGAKAFDKRAEHLMNRLYLHYEKLTANQVLDSI